MIEVESKPLPHKVGNASVASPELKSIVMQFMENFLSIGGQLFTVQTAVRELQKRKVVSPEIEDIETYVSRAESAASTATAAKASALSAAGDAATAKNDAVSAKNDAVSAKNDAVSAKTAAQSASGDASGYATDASGSAGDAAGSASDASASALSAAQSAAQAQAAAAATSYVTGLAFCELGFGDAITTTNYKRFYLTDLVLDPTRTYVVTVAFYWAVSPSSTSSSSFTCGIAVGGAGDTGAVLPLDPTGHPDTHKSVVIDKDHRRETCSVEISGADAFFQLTNRNNSAIQITVKIALLAQGGE